MSQAEAIDYSHDIHPEPGQLHAVAPGVHWLRMPLPFQLDHVNLWLLEDGEGYALVDTGVALDSIKAVWEDVLASHCRQRPIRRIVVTHYHPDHLGLAAWLAQRLDAPVAISQGEILAAHCVWGQAPGYSFTAMAEQFRRHGLDDQRRQALLDRGNGYRLGVPEVPAQYDRLMDGTRLTIDGRAWRVIMGYGHSPEHAALYCESLGLLIAGDMVLPRISTNVSVFAATPNADPLRLFLDSTHRYAGLPADTLVLPSHGRPFRGLQARVASLHAHHRERCDLLLEAAAQPRSAAELLPVLFARELDTLQVMFAMGEAVAHLNYLHGAGEMRRLVSDDGLVRFVASIQ